MPEPESPKSQLLRYGLVAKRHFGQNFLADRSIAQRIAMLAAPEGASVVELGAGLGALTRPLLERAMRVIAVERDRDLIPALRAELAEPLESGKLVLLEADAKSIDLTSLLGELPRPHVLCGNLPYQITGPLLELCVHAAPVLDRAVFLVQLEVAARLAAKAGSDDYGALSVFVQAAYEVTRELVVRRGAFYPQPGVDSAVVSLVRRERGFAETPAFVELVHAAFGQRRKKLGNAWRGLFGLRDEELGELAREAAIDLGARGETLGVEDFARMASAVEARKSR